MQIPRRPQFASTPGAQIAGNSLANGLWGFWPCNEGGGSLLQDLLGRNNATISGAVNWVNGPQGPAVSLNGSTSYINIPHAPDSSQPLTFALWLYWNASTEAYNSLFTNEAPGYTWLLKSTQLPAFYNNGTGVDPLGSTSVPFGQWVHIVLTWGAGLPSNTLNFYLNGVLAATTSFASAGTAGGTVNVRVGGNSPFGSGRWINGKMRDIGIWKRALTANEVQTLYQTPNYMLRPSPRQGRGFGSPIEAFRLTSIIPSNVHFGAETIGVKLSQLYMIPSSVAFGASSVVDKTLTVYINGVDQTDLLLAGSLQIQMALSQSATASFGVWDSAGSFSPQVGQEVLIYRNGVRLFGGTIEQPAQSAYQAITGHLFAGSGGQSGGVGSATGASGSGASGIHCTDFANLLDRRYVTQYYQAVSNSLSSIVADIVRIYLSADGIIYSFTGDPGINLGPQLFNTVTARQAFNTLSSLTGWDFSIDAYKVLRFFPSGSGIGSAPFNIADNDGHVLAESLSLEYYRSTYRNRQGIRAPSQTNILWTDTFSTAIPGPFPNEPQPPDGVRISFGTLYIVTGLPVVKVNGGAQTVIDINNPATPITTPGAQWYILGGPTGQSYGVNQVPGHTPLSSSDVLTISYTAPVSVVTWVQNDAQIAARAAIEGNSGVYEDVQDAPNNVTDPVAILAYAEGLLARYSAGIPFQVDYTTTDLASNSPQLLTALIQPGQLQNIVCSNPSLSFNGLISAVKITDIDKTYLQYSITVLSGEYQGNWSQFFAALVAQAQLPQPSNNNTYSWQIGPSIPGIASPGMGTQNYITPAPAIIKSVTEQVISMTVYFTGAHPAPCTMTFTLLQNGSAVLAATIPQGISGTASTTTVNPSSTLRLYAGDTLTVQVFFSTLFLQVQDVLVTVNTSVLVT